MGDIEKHGSHHGQNSDSLSRTSTKQEDIEETEHPVQEPISRTKSIASRLENTVLSRLTTRSIVNPGPPPDGGWKAWLQVFCAWLAIMNTWGFVNSFGAFQTYYSEILPQSPSTISWIGSIQACLMFLLGIFSGRALDAGLFLPTIMVGIAFQIVGIFTMSVSKNYWQLFLTQGVLTGIGGGIFFTPCMGLVSTYFAKKRGMALGIVTSGNSFGGIIYPLVVRQLLPKIGFGWTVRVLGFMNLIALGIIIAFMRPRLPPRKAGPIVELAALKDVPYILFVAGICFCISAIYFVFYYIGSFARDTIGISYIGSLNLVIVLNGVGIPARIIPGIIADRYLGVLNTHIPLICASVVLLYSWTAISSLGGFYTFTVIYGMIAGGWQSLFPTAIASLSDDLSRAGTRLGMAFSSIALAALVGGPIGGQLIAKGDGYWPGIVWCATTTLVGCVFVIAARIVKYGTTWKVKC
ncbi:MFS transporter, MCP family, solute carrier family 16, member 10 [Microthyrium microscopicum]|uniref:MFS transporter, MCP family, solute carrier family 16, member 10 n=1 Tax=Microthyrium microscopicum TaxID=703497 RepID=A0A6A6USX0_9PEZI|nr:MFS transporter, MCP family, solute carrier family 16, member 10 [Microthyrium microscopicum]